MKRSTQREVAKQTVEIVERGSYESPGGRVIDIAESVRECLGGTRLFSPEDLEALRRTVLDRPPASVATAFEVVNETALHRELRQCQR